jgi:hypothetical protein
MAAGVDVVVAIVPVAVAGVAGIVATKAARKAGMLQGWR